MSYSIIDCFMIAFGCGIIYGLVYEALRIVRRVFDILPVIFVCDVLFFIGAAFFVFNLSMYLGNYVRIYTILGFGAGVFTYIQTIGRLASLIETLILKLWNATFGALFRKFSSLLGKTVMSFAHKTAGEFGKINDFLKNRSKNAVSHLHFKPKSLYNNSNAIREKDTAIGERSEKNNVIKAYVRRG